MAPTSPKMIVTSVSRLNDHESSKLLAIVMLPWIWVGMLDVPVELFGSCVLIAQGWVLGMIPVRALVWKIQYAVSLRFAQVHLRFFSWLCLRLSGEDLLGWEGGRLISIGLALGLYSGRQYDGTGNESEVCLDDGLPNDEGCKVFRYINTELPTTSKGHTLKYAVETQLMPPAVCVRSGLHRSDADNIGPIFTVLLTSHLDRDALIRGRTPAAQ